MSNSTSSIFLYERDDSKILTFKSLLFSIASAIAVYKSTSKSFFNISFCSLIFLILAKSPSADLEITSAFIGSGLLFAHEISIPNDRINNILNILLKI